MQARAWLPLMLVVACGDDDGAVQPDLDASVDFVCTSAPDAATALGVRGVDLWNAFVGVHSLVASGSRVAGNKVEYIEPLATFTITVSRSDQPFPGLTACEEVSVPVQVVVQSANPPVNETVLGRLRGSTLFANITFASPEYLEHKPLRFVGWLSLRAGKEPELVLDTDPSTRWTSPPRQVTP